MKDCILTMKSQTNAERARRAAASIRVDAQVVSVDPNVTRLGCSYGLRLSCASVERVKSVLIKRGIPFGDVIGGGLG